MALPPSSAAALPVNRKTPAQIMETNFIFGLERFCGGDVP
jgi:hypothetical protein